MKIIDHAMLRSLGISPQEAYQWVEEELSKKPSSVLPPKISMYQKEHVFYNVMPCILPESDCMGVKIITRHPEKKQGPSLTSQILLYELSSGKLLAIFDGSYITAMRTGAVAAHSLRLFSNPDYSNIGIMGLGITATATMDVLTAIEPERTIHVHLLRYKNQAELFAQRYQEKKNLHFVFHDTPEALISVSEVILSCVTFAEHDFADISAYKPGCVVIPVHSMGFQNCDTQFDKIFVDDIKHVENFKYFKQFKSVAEVSDVIRGTSVGRETKQERILVYNIGLAIHDVYFANKILEKLPSRTEAEVELEGPFEKMWL